jgi:hypothetical protein
MACTARPAAVRNLTIAINVDHTFFTSRDADPANLDSIARAMFLQFAPRRIARPRPRAPHPECT